MKPRKRLEQTQYGSMYLRSNYHRDVIYQDMYHNALWLKREQDGKQIDEVGWIRYPQEAIYGQDTNTYGWMDINRQFQFARGLIQDGFNNNYFYYFRTQNIIMQSYGRNTGANLANYITEDGIVWKTLTDPYQLLDLQYFGDDSIFRMTVSGTNYTLQVYTPIKNPTNDSWALRERTFTITGSGNPAFVCNTHNGIIVTEW